MLRSLSLGVSTLLVLILGMGAGPGSSAASGSDQASLKAKPVRPALTAATEGPRIIDFRVDPARVVEGEQSTFRWRVEPGTSGSPIQTFQILDTELSTALYARVLLQGEYPTPRLVTGGRGRCQFTLKVVDQAGRTASRTVEVSTGSIEALIAGISGFAAEVATRVDGAHRDHLATLSFENTSGLALGNFTIYVVQAYAPLMAGADLPAGPVVGTYNGSYLSAGRNEFRMGLSLASTAAQPPDSRRPNKLVFLFVRESSPGVIDRVFVKALAELVETPDSGGRPLFSVRLIKVS